MRITNLAHAFERVHPSNHISFDPDSDNTSLAVIARFLDAALQVWDDEHLDAKSQVRAAAAMLRSYSDNSPGDRPHAARPSDSAMLAPWQVRKVKEFIDASIRSRIRLSDCAKQARLSASYFSCAFKATLGTTLRHYIRCRRIECAQQLMLSSTLPLSQIALASGFSDQAHYCRVFRDVVGMTPTVWRRRNMQLAPDE